MTQVAKPRDNKIRTAEQARRFLAKVNRTPLLREGVLTQKMFVEAELKELQERLKDQ